MLKKGNITLKKTPKWAEYISIHPFSINDNSAVVVHRRAKRWLISLQLQSTICKANVSQIWISPNPVPTAVSRRVHTCPHSSEPDGLDGFALPVPPNTHLFYKSLKAEPSSVLHHCQLQSSISLHIHFFFWLFSNDSSPLFSQTSLLFNASSPLTRLVGPGPTSSSSSSVGVSQNRHIKVSLSCHLQYLFFLYINISLFSSLSVLFFF